MKCRLSAALLSASRIRHPALSVKRRKHFRCVENRFGLSCQVYHAVVSEEKFSTQKAPAGKCSQGLGLCAGVSLTGMGFAAINSHTNGGYVDIHMTRLYNGSNTFNHFFSTKVKSMIGTAAAVFTTPAAARTSRGALT